MSLSLSLNNHESGAARDPKRFKETRGFRPEEFIAETLPKLMEGAERWRAQARGMTSGGRPSSELQGVFSKPEASS